jgi:hypothetical protein
MGLSNGTHHYWNASYNPLVLHIVEIIIPESEKREKYGKKLKKKYGKLWLKRIVMQAIKGFV